MSAEIIDGRKVAALMRASVREDVEQRVAKGNRPPFLQVILVGDEYVTVSHGEKQWFKVEIFGVDWSAN